MKHNSNTVVYGSTELGRRWKTLDAKTKLHYCQLAGEAKKEFLSHKIGLRELRSPGQMGSVKNGKHLPLLQSIQGPEFPIQNQTNKKNRVIAGTGSDSLYTQGRDQIKEDIYPKIHKEVRSEEKPRMNSSDETTWGLESTSSYYRQDGFQMEELGSGSFTQDEGQFQYRNPGTMSLKGDKGFSRTENRRNIRIAKKLLGRQPSSTYTVKTLEPFCPPPNPVLVAECPHTGVLSPVSGEDSNLYSPTYRITDEFGNMIFHPNIYS